MAETVKVGCRLPQGIVLRVSEWGKDGLGDRQLRETGTMTLAGSGQHSAAPGLAQEASSDVTLTEVPADLWSAWYEANKDGDLVKSGTVFKDGDDPLKGDEPAEEAPQAEPQATAPQVVGPQATEEAKPSQAANVRPGPKK